MPVIKARAIKRPAVTPLMSSILDHATVETLSDADHFDLVNEVGLWPSYNCMDLFNSTQMCPDPTEEKTEFTSAPWIPGFSFAVYGGVECNLVGLDREDQKAEMLRVFEANEGRGIERAIKENRFLARTIDPARPPHRQVEWDEPVDLTPAGVEGGINVKTALAILEGYSATVYAGVPTIHMPRAAISLISDMVQWRPEGGTYKAYTPAGSKIAVGGGYDEVDLPLTGALDLYATGEVYIERSERVEVQTQELNGAAGAAFDSNTSVGLVERAYRVGVDCFVAKATGTLWPSNDVPPIRP